MVSIVIHGGAWAIPDSIAIPTKKGVEEAARVGYEVLRAGGSAIDAVQVHSFIVVNLYMAITNCMWITFHVIYNIRPPIIACVSFTLSVRPQLRAWRVTQYSMQGLGQF